MSGRRAIVNLSTAKFARGQIRLRETLIGKTDADVVLYQKEEEVGAPSHRQSPYGFKPWAVLKAYRALGYDVVLWMDASMYVIKDLGPLFSYIEEKGYFFQDSEWTNPRWTTPAQREYFGSDQGKMISAGFIGLDFRNGKAVQFLHEWLLAEKKGLFKGTREETRHDQSCASLIITEMGLTITDNHTFWTYGEPGGVYPDNILVLAHGIC